MRADISTGGTLKGVSARSSAIWRDARWRRPVSLTETTRLRQLFALSRERGGTFDESLAVALQAILVSPHFLFPDRG
jgi:hypothetical protein